MNNGISLSTELLTTHKFSTDEEVFSWQESSRREKFPEKLQPTKILTDKIVSKEFSLSWNFLIRQVFRWRKVCGVKKFYSAEKFAKNLASSRKYF